MNFGTIYGSVFLITFIKTTAAVFWTDCYQTTAQEYNGTTSQTWSGRPCQRWDVQSPHIHVYTDPSDFPDGNLTLANDYCRQPDRSGDSRPWCYTTQDNFRWDYCFIYNCDILRDLGDADCYMTEPYEYNGNTDTTKYGTDCQRWDSQSTSIYTDPFDYPDATLSEAGNFCRNPDRGTLSEIPWCYIAGAIRWQYCNITSCNTG